MKVSYSVQVISTIYSKSELTVSVSSEDIHSLLTLKMKLPLKTQDGFVYARYKCVWCRDTGRHNGVVTLLTINFREAKRLVGSLLSSLCWYILDLADCYDASNVASPKTRRLAHTTLGIRNSSSESSS